MLVVSMGCGLGNQMFEYAFYKHLCKKYTSEIIKLDIRHAFPFAHNGIELFDIFDLSGEVASKQEVLFLTSGYGLHGVGFEYKTIFHRIGEKVRKLFSLTPQTMKIQDDYTEYYNEFFNVMPGKSVYYLGVFANYHYFKEIQYDIKNIYKFPTIDDLKNKRYAEKMENCNSVSIHVRRGDYVSEGVKLTPLSFYRKAILKIEEKVKNAHFFVFADDVEYARSLFPDNDHYTFVEGNNGKNSFRDMQLMSLCKHNITANSTFSFWGAFLNSNPSKIVIAPNLPYTGAKYPFVCDDWVLI
ncbi:alpha-1,2-fucosyltransferase [Anaerovibrio sp. RM50]|uniref:alpha-1,2-fucosyltransferase n=1 Tax=Anaerovibrio sp. RM50 TaxID=1200557 RepID=UPI000480AB11|nr:alpha-1,2-fucosyltransferase [Anaerovibrio sp. RM50]